MPVYEIYCVDCSEIREVLVPVSERNKKVKCPTCKKDMKKRIGKVHLSSKRVTFGY